MAENVHRSVQCARPPAVERVADATEDEHDTGGDHPDNADDELRVEAGEQAQEGDADARGVELRLVDGYVAPEAHAGVDRRERQAARIVGRI